MVIFKDTANKRAWIKTVEAFIAILLFLAVVLIIMGEKNRSQDISERVHNDQISILRYIQLNDNLRTEILNTAGDVSWDNFSIQAPNTKNAIESKKPTYLNCEAKICGTGSVCSLNTTIKKSVYSESTLITSSPQEFEPKVLRLFCWVK